MRLKSVWCWVMLLVCLVGASAVAADLMPCPDALDTLNRQRAARGLPPYQRDGWMQMAAEGAANFRGKNCIEGHTSNDFAYVPAEIRPWVSAAGCAAWSWTGEFGACACYENWQYAGAAWCTGRDGRVYMHLFVGNHPPFRSN